jgi:hypothetical protein
MAETFAGEVRGTAAARSSSLSGKEAASPPPPPLRTGLESFPSSGSSLR